MNETMIEKWNAVVGKNDLVIHLGDFSLGSKEKRRGIRDRLNGTILLVLGSHDGGKWRIARDGFIVTEGSLIIGDLLFTHKPLGKVPPGKYNVHGHIHQKETSGRRINVSVDATGFTPVSLKELEEEAAK